MAIVKNSPGYRVDGRVAIGLDALADHEQLAVRNMIADRKRFLESAADSRKVKKISMDGPLYALRGPAGLRIIYSRVGDEIVVIDLMQQETLDRYGRKVPKAKRNGSRGVRSVASGVKKAKSP